MKTLALLFACLSFQCLQAELFFNRQMIETHLQGYSEEEKQLLEKDLTVVRSVCLDGTKNSSSKFLLATAGAPGARKTTILERFVSTHPEYQSGVYLDPDPRTLKFMVHTYYARSLNALEIANATNYDEVIKNAYNKWRAGSNYIVLTLLEEAFNLGRSVIYGTTATGGHIPAFLTKIKDNGYEIILLLCSCEDSLRYDAVDYRNKIVRFYQSSPEDALAKGELFPQRMGAYFAHADQLYFYWSDTAFGPERLGGIWKQGQLEIIDADAMQKFINKYEADRENMRQKGHLIPAFKTYFDSKV